MRDLLTPSARTLESLSALAIARTALVTVAGFVIYGLTVGYWRSPLMGVYVAVKMPLLIALTLACNTLLNGLIGLLLGSGLGIKQSLHALLSAFAISALILGSIAPVTFFLTLNIPPAGLHSAYLLAHTLLIGLAGLVGVIRLGKLLESYSGSKAIAHSTLAAWIAGNAFLGMQFSWILRPFFGSPQLKVEFLREHPMRGSFYEAVWRSLIHVAANITMAGWLLLIVIALTVFISLLIKPTRRNQHHERI